MQLDGRQPICSGWTVIISLNMGSEKRQRQTDKLVIDLV